MAAAAPAAGAIQLPTISGVLRGRELTRKQARLQSSIEPVDLLLDGGLPRGRISEITGRKSSGKTALAIAFIAAATRRGETAAVIDWEGAFDPESAAAAGADLSRILWVHPEPAIASRPGPRVPSILKNCLKAAEMTLEAGGFGLLLIDLGERGFAFAPGAALRIARMAERAGTTVIIVAGRPVCGTFAATSLVLDRLQTFFSRNRYPASSLDARRTRDTARTPLYGGAGPALFDGIRLKAVISRNKLGRTGASVQLPALTDSAAAIAPPERRTSVLPAVRLPAAPVSVSAPAIGEQPAALP